MDQSPEENPNREKAKESASDLQDASKRKTSLSTSATTGVASSYIDAQGSTFSGSSNLKVSESGDNDSTEDGKLTCLKTRCGSFHAQASTSSGSSNSKYSESIVHGEAGNKTTLHQKPNGDAKNKRIPSPIPEHAFRAFELLQDAVGSLVSNKNLWDEVVEKRVKEISKKLNEGENANNSGQGTKASTSTKNQSEGENPSKRPRNRLADLMSTAFEVFQGIFGTQFPPVVVILAISIIVMRHSRNCNPND